MLTVAPEFIPSSSLSVNFPDWTLDWKLYTTDAHAHTHTGPVNPVGRSHQACEFGTVLTERQQRGSCGSHGSADLWLTRDQFHLLLLSLTSAPRTCTPVPRSEAGGILFCVCVYVSSFVLWWCSIKWKICICGDAAASSNGLLGNIWLLELEP